MVFELLPLLMGPAGIAVVILGLVGIIFKNKFGLAGALLIITYLVWQANIFPWYVIGGLALILLFMIKDLKGR